jgi:hypothetical protein
VEKQNICREVDGLCVFKVWSFGVGGAVAEAGCEDVV